MASSIESRSRNNAEPAEPRAMENLSEGQAGVYLADLNNLLLAADNVRDSDKKMELAEKKFTRTLNGLMQLDTNKLSMGRTLEVQTALQRVMSAVSWSDETRETVGEVLNQYEGRIKQGVMKKAESQKLKEAAKKQSEKDAEGAAAKLAAIEAMGAAPRAGNTEVLVHDDTNDVREMAAVKPDWVEAAKASIPSRAKKSPVSEVPAENDWVAAAKEEVLVKNAAIRAGVEQDNPPVREYKSVAEEGIDDKAKIVTYSEAAREQLEQKKPTRERVGDEEYISRPGQVLIRKVKKPGFFAKLFGKK